jgi:demethylmenaquinone methyltransferase/2-methoxy-6-polyprenyl-1,4-benzoquinol methylase
MLTPTQQRQLYRKRARWYDVTANLYYLVGFREQAYRRMAVRRLGLSEGDTVVEIGCGTGLNFALLQREIGRSGRLIGVDMTPEMLAQARRRVQQHGWANVDLVQSRAAHYEPPPHVNGIISTFALTLEPEYDAVIQRGARALKPGGRFVVLDFKVPERWPRWLLRFWLWITRPFGVTLDLGERHPWESIASHLADCRFQTLYWGLAYIAAGTAEGEGTPISLPSERQRPETREATE